MTLTDEQRKQLLELSLISAAQKKVSNMFKEDRVKPTPKPKPEPEPELSVRYDKITDEQKAQLLELALIVAARKKVANMFKDACDIRRLPPEPKAAPKPKLSKRPRHKYDANLIPTYPHCGSRDILDPVIGLNLNYECFDCKAVFDCPVFTEGRKRRGTIDQTKLPEKGVRNIPKKHPKKSKQEKRKTKNSGNQYRTPRSSPHKVFCPHCGSAWIRRPKLNSSHYRCHNCGASFKEPVQSWDPGVEWCNATLEPATYYPIECKPDPVKLLPAGDINEC